MSSIGEKLEAARARRGLTLDQVSSSTRISLKYLAALEKDDRGCFPAAFFYKSFVLQYARYLEVDERAISALLDPMLAAEAPPALPGQGESPGDLTRRLTPMPRPGDARSGSQRKLAGSFVSFVLVLGACSGLYSWWRDARGAGVFAWNDRAAQTPVPAAAARPVPAASAPTTAAAADAARTPAASTPAAAVPAAASRLSLNLAATEATWLSVSSDGKPVFSGLLQPNETKALAAEARAKVIVGNAGGLSVEWNGRTLGALGRRGQVRVITFTNDGYQFQDNNSRADARPPDSTE